MLVAFEGCGSYSRNPKPPSRLTKKCPSLFPGHGSALRWDIFIVALLITPTYNLPMGLEEVVRSRCPEILSRSLPSDPLWRWCGLPLLRGTRGYSLGLLDPKPLLQIQSSSFGASSGAEGMSLGV